MAILTKCATRLRCLNCDLHLGRHDRRCIHINRSRRQIASAGASNLPAVVPHALRAPRHGSPRAPPGPPRARTSLATVTPHPLASAPPRGESPPPALQATGIQAPHRPQPRHRDRAAARRDRERENAPPRAAAGAEPQSRDLRKRHQAPQARRQPARRPVPLPRRHRGLRGLPNGGVPAHCRVLQHDVRFRVSPLASRVTRCL